LGILSNLQYQAPPGTKVKPPYTNLKPPSEDFLATVLGRNLRPLNSWPSISRWKAAAASGAHNFAQPVTYLKNWLTCCEIVQVLNSKIITSQRKTVFTFRGLVEPMNQNNVYDGD